MTQRFSPLSWGTSRALAAACLMLAFNAAAAFWPKEAAPLITLQFSEQSVVLRRPPAEAKSIPVVVEIKPAAAHPFRFRVAVAGDEKSNLENLELLGDSVQTDGQAYLNVPVGASRISLMVRARANETKGEETFVFRLIGGPRLRIAGRDSQVVSIRDAYQPRVVQFNTDELRLLEGAKGEVFLELNDAVDPDFPLEVAYSWTGTDPAGQLQWPASGRVHFSHEQKRAALEISANADKRYEGGAAQAFVLTLKDEGNSAFRLGATKQLNVTVTDADVLPTYELAFEKKSETRGEPVQLICKASVASAAAAKISFRLDADAQAFASPKSPLQKDFFELAPGALQALKTIPTDRFDWRDGDRTLTAKLADAPADAPGVDILLEERVQISLTASSLIAAETGLPIELKLTSSHPNGWRKPIQLNLRASGTAICGSDYEIAFPGRNLGQAGAREWSDSITLEANAQTAVLQLLPKKDAIDESDKSFQLSISSDDKEVFCNPSASQIQIQFPDDDDPPLVRFVTTAATVFEGRDLIAELELVLTPPDSQSELPYRVFYRWTGGDRIGSVDIPVNQRSAKILIPIADDRVRSKAGEPDKEIVVTLESESSTTKIAPDGKTAKITVVDDDRYDGELLVLVAHTPLLQDADCRARLRELTSSSDKRDKVLGDAMITGEPIFFDAVNDGNWEDLDSPPKAWTPIDATHYAQIVNRAVEIEAKVKKARNDKEFKVALIMPTDLNDTQDARNQALREEPLRATAHREHGVMVLGFQDRRMPAGEGPRILFEYAGKRRPIPVPRNEEQGAADNLKSWLESGFPLVVPEPNAPPSK